MKTYPNNTAFCRNMRARRRELDMSQSELATFCGLTKTNISNYERGYNQPSIEVAMTIAKALKCSVDELRYTN